MADWGQDDAVIAPAKTTPPKESWGQDDEVVKVDVRGFGDREPSKPSSSIFGDKVSTQTLSDLVTGKEPPQTTGLGTFAREAILASPSTAVGVGVGTAVATATAPFGPYVAIPATIIAGGAAGFAANYLGEEGLTALEESSPLAKKYMSMLSVDKATRDAGRREHEYAALTGQLASAGPFVSTKTASTALSRSLAERGFSGTIQAGVGAGQRAATGQDQDLGKTLLEFGGGALLPGKLTALGEKTVPPKFRPKEVPITPTQKGTTPQQQAEFLAKTKKIKAERDAVAPLVETALRNKETGEIERMGPKHDEARKAETIDTHEQGFVDERGNFHERQAAVDQAKRAGQIPQDYVLESAVGEPLGLRSGDLRKVGDERFAITEDQPAGTPKPPIEETIAPITRQEHKDAIDKLEEQAYMNLEIDRQAAYNTGDTKGVAEVEAQQAVIEQQIANLRKSMPGVEFKNKALPTWEEVHDHLYGSRTVGQAFDRILSTDGLGTRGQRALLRILNESQFIRDADLYFTNDYLKYTDQYGKEQNAAGMYTGGDKVHKIEMARDGDIRALAHEAMHAGTQRLIELGNSVAAVKLKNLQEKFLAEHNRRYQEALEQFQRDNIAPTIGELKAFEKANRQPYGFTNTHEFVAEAFTRRNFKEILASIKSTEPGTGVLSNLWQEFKNIVNEGLNIPKGERTVFDDVMDYGAALVEESKGFQRDSSGKITLLPSKLSEEIQSQLQREGIPVAHTSPHKFDEPNWIKHALTGEGTMFEGAGFYLSTGDKVNEYYWKMSKRFLRDKLFNENSKLRTSEGTLKIDANVAKNERNASIGALKAFEDNEVVRRAQYEASRTFDDYINDANEWYERLDPNSQEAKLEYKEHIKVRKQKLDEALKEETKLKDAVSKSVSKSIAANDKLEILHNKIDEQTKAATYHFTLETKLEELLDWNSTTQSKLVKKAFDKLGINEYELGKDNAYYDEADGYQPGSATGEELYRALSNKFKPVDEVNKGNLTEKEASTIGDIKASIALIEQGVVGHVYNAQGGQETKFRNYVAYDTKRLKQNVVTLASRVEPKVTKEKTKTSSSPDEFIIKSTGEIITDRTKTSPRNVKNEEEFIDIATDIYEKHGDVEAIKFFDGWQEFKKTWAEPVREIENFVGINLNSKVANERIVHNNTADLKELAGKDVNLEQLSFDIDKGVTLEGKAKDVADRFRTLMDDLGKRALENGVIKGWHENYVARNVVSEGNAPKGALEEFMRDAFGYGDKASGGGTKTTTKYGQERRLKTREDLTNHINGINTWLEQNGKDYRFKLKTDNLADIYKDYALSVEKAIENKSLIDNIKQIRNVEGESLIKPITPENPLPYGWKQIDHPDLAGFAIHPDLVAPLKFVFDSGPGMTMQALGTVSQAVKRVNVIGSFFHAKSLMEVLSSAKIPLWTPLKDAIVLPLVEKGVKAVTGKDLQLSAITKAVEQYRRGGLGDNVDTWIKSNLNLDSNEDVSRGILSSTGKFADTMIGKYGPKTRVLEKSMSITERYTLNIFDKYTWDYLHTGGKIMVADAYLEKARFQAAKEGKPFNEMAARKEIAAFVNDSFGGLNWFEAARSTEGEFAKRMAMAAYSPEGRRAMQVLLFAPDWTTSTIRAFTAALPKSLNPTKLQPIEGIKGMINPTTKADYARLYQFKTALLYLTLLNVINNMTAGRNIWDNKDPTRIEWPDGTSMQAMKHAMEPYHWIAAPDKTLANKLGFIPKAAVISIAGTEYASPNAPKLVDMSATGRLKAIGQSALPFQAQAAIGAPEGEGVKRAVLGTAGFPIYGSTPEQRKQKKKERETQLKANAAAYHKKAKEKGWEQ